MHDDELLDEEKDTDKEDEMPGMRIIEADGDDEVEIVDEDVAKDLEKDADEVDADDLPMAAYEDEEEEM